MNRQPGRPSAQPLNIWCFTDNKPGHRNQLQGLINALSTRRTVNSNWLQVDGSFWQKLKELRQHYKVHAPDLILGAGHTTHKYLLLSRWLFGVKTVVLMKPSLPLSWFDLALIPEHDGRHSQANVITTRGVINQIKPGQQKNARKGLFLIGGPSKHYGWNNQQLAEQITAIVSAYPELDWQLTTSRRTPEDFLAYLPSKTKNLTITPHTECNPSWLPQQLSDAGPVWVTEDSVSMIYEALTAGAITGLLEVPIIKPGRLQQGIKSLLQDALLFRYSDWLKHPAIKPRPVQLNEADRCAELILKDFLL